MKQQPQLAAMIKGQVFDGFLLTRSAAQKTSSNGSKYLDMTLCDISTEVNAKMWDGLTPPPAVATVLRVRGMMLEYNGRPQLRVDKMRPATEADDYDMQLLAPCAPDSPEQMRGEIDARIAQMADPQLQALVQRRLEACGDKLRYYPAASKLHHAERSGLLHHMTTMLRAANAIMTVYPQLNPSLLTAGVIVHDLAKIDEMDADTLGLVSDYSIDGKLLGHIVRGVVNIQAAAEKTGASRAKALLLQHMVLSHHGIPEYGSPMAPKFPEAEVLNMIDTLDARLYEMDEALSRAIPGGFSEKVWGLDNRQLYRIPDEQLTK